jgi:hypothetical protein
MHSPGSQDAASARLGQWSRRYKAASGLLTRTEATDDRLRRDRRECTDYLAPSRLSASPQLRPPPLKVSTTVIELRGA